MLEPRYSPRLVALPQPLGLPVAHPHQHRAIRKPKSPRLHPRQHSASLQLSLTQCCPPHSTSFGGHRKGTLLSRSQGDIIKVAQQPGRLFEYRYEVEAKSEAATGSKAKIASSGTLLCGPASHRGNRGLSKALSSRCCQPGTALGTCCYPYQPN